jgi:MFS transporter, DHA2 family, multidrug resistance protein
MMHDHGGGQETPPRATAREWRGLAVLALPTLLLSLDVSVLYLALPQLSTDLGASSTEQLWILDIYSFLLAGFLVTMGALGDRIGRRRLLLIGAGAFGVASVVAAYATTPEMLIAARAALGVAGATLAPSTMALIRNMFPDPRQMGQAIGIWFACFMGGMTLGPLVGGALLEHFWWGSAFLLGVPFMVLLLVTGPFLLPEFRDTGAGRLDLVSVGLSLVAILPFIYGLKEVARHGLSTAAVSAIVAGVAFGTAFVRRQRRLASPLLDLKLFANRTFSVALGILLLGGIVMAGISLMSTMYLQTVLGLSPLAAGMWLIPQNIAMIAGSIGAPKLAQRFKPAYVMAAGLGTAALGVFLHTQVGPEGGLPLLIAGLVLAAGGISLPMPLGTNFVMASTPPEKAGSAASIQETGGEFGVAMGVALMGSLATFIYRAQIADTAPAGLPADAAAAARDGVASAMTTAQQLPGTLGDPARTAFTAGLNVVGVAGAVIFAGLTILAVAVLRKVGDPTVPAPVAEPEPERELVGVD